MNKTVVSIVMCSVLLASCGQKESESVVEETPTPTNPVVEQETMEKEAMVQEVDETVAMEKMSEDVVEVEETMMKEESENEAMEEEVVVVEEVIINEPDGSQKQVIAAGTFANYDEALVGNSEHTVLFFHAGWCPSCVALEKGITAGDIPYGLTILKADFDNETELKKKYGVLSQHTLVYVDADGNQIKKWAGGNTVDSIVEKLN